MGSNLQRAIAEVKVFIEGKSYLYFMDIVKCNLAEMAEKVLDTIPHDNLLLNSQYFCNNFLKDNGFGLPTFQNQSIDVVITM